MEEKDIKFKEEIERDRVEIADLQQRVKEIVARTSNSVPIAKRKKEIKKLKEQITRNEQQL